MRLNPLSPSDNPMNEVLFCFGSGENETGGGSAADFDDTVSTSVGGGATGPYNSVVDREARAAAGSDDYTDVFVGDEVAFERAQRATGDIPTDILGGGDNETQAGLDRVAAQAAREVASKPRSTAQTIQELKELDLAQQATMESINQINRDLQQRTGAPTPVDRVNIFDVEEFDPFSEMQMGPLSQQIAAARGDTLTPAEYREIDQQLMDQTAAQLSALRAAVPASERRPGIEIPGQTRPINFTDTEAEDAAQAAQEQALSDYLNNLEGPMYGQGVPGTAFQGGQKGPIYDTTTAVTPGSRFDTTGQYSAVRGSRFDTQSPSSSVQPVDVARFTDPLTGGITDTPTLMSDILDYYDRQGATVKTTVGDDAYRARPGYEGMMTEGVDYEVAGPANISSDPGSVVDDYNYPGIAMKSQPDFDGGDVGDFYEFVSPEVQKQMDALAKEPARPEGLAALMAPGALAKDMFQNLTNRDRAFARQVNMPGNQFQTNAQGQITGIYNPRENAVYTPSSVGIFDLKAQEAAAGDLYGMQRAENEARSGAEGGGQQAAAQAPTIVPECPEGYQYNASTNACEYVASGFPVSTTGTVNTGPYQPTTQYTGVAGLQPFVLQPSYRAPTSFSPLYNV